MKTVFEKIVVNIVIIRRNDTQKEENSKEIQWSSNKVQIELVEKKWTVEHVRLQMMIGFMQ